MSSGWGFSDTPNSEFIACVFVKCAQSLWLAVSLTEDKTHNGYPDYWKLQRRGQHNSGSVADRHMIRRNLSSPKYVEDNLCQIYKTV